MRVHTTSGHSDRPRVTDPDVAGLCRPLVVLLCPYIDPWLSVGWTASSPALEVEIVPPVLRWTGWEARLLREASRMSVRAFAAHLGYNDAAVSNWERRGRLARLRTQTQRDLDAALRLADEETKERFSAALANSVWSADPRSGDGRDEFRWQVAHLELDPLDRWTELLRVLITAANAMGCRGLLSLVRVEVAAMQRHLGDTSNGRRGRLLATMARWLEFGSWVADNAGRDQTAGAWLEMAGRLARDIGDHALAGYVRMRQAQRAVEGGDAAACVTLAEAIVVDTSLPTTIRALGAIRRGHAYAVCGEAKEARDSLAVAFDLVENAGTRNESGAAGWVDHCTRGYLQGYGAICRLELGQAEAAADELRLVLSRWPATQRLDEGLFRARLALALERTGQRDAARAEAAAARRLGQETGSTRVLAVVDQLHSVPRRSG